MAVLLPNVELRIAKRPHPAPRDDRGQIVQGPLGAPTGPYPCGVKDRPETGTWSIRLDPSMWPCEAGDEVSDGTRVWVLTGEPQLHTVTGNNAVDYIAARGVLNPPETP